MKKGFLYLLFPVFVAFVGCRHIKIHSGADYYSTYDARTHRSTYTNLPFPDLVLPGKWWRLRNDRGAESREPIFYNEDSTFVWLDRYPRQQFDFNRQVRSGADFLQRYWAAISKTWERRSLQVELLLWYAEQNYLICKTLPEEPCCTLHLIGFRNDRAYHFSIKGDLDDAEKINLLESLYILN